MKIYRPLLSKYDFCHSLHLLGASLSLAHAKFTAVGIAEYRHRRARPKTTRLPTVHGTIGPVSAVIARYVGTSQFILELPTVDDGSSCKLLAALHHDACFVRWKLALGFGKIFVVEPVHAEHFCVILKCCCI